MIRLLFVIQGEGNEKAVEEGMKVWKGLETRIVLVECRLMELEAKVKKLRLFDEFSKAVEEERMRPERNGSTERSTGGRARPAAKRSGLA